MKLTKENLIITLKAMEDVIITTKKTSFKMNDKEVNSYYNGRLDTISVIITMLEDEDEFDSMSTYLMGITNRYGQEYKEGK